jgi:hypothetical protein
MHNCNNSYAPTESVAAGKKKKEKKIAIGFKTAQQKKKLCAQRFSSFDTE